MNAIKVNKFTKARTIYYYYTKSTYKKNFARFDVFEEYSKVCKMGKMFFLSIIACMKLNALQEVLMSKDNTRWDIRIKGARN